MTKGQAMRATGAGSLTSRGELWRDTLLRFRAHAHLTQEELAHELQVTVSTVNRWERGHSTPSKLAQGAVAKLAEKYNFRGF